MANYLLNETWQTDIQTTFRFEIHLSATSPELGLTEDVVGYIQRCDLPAAPSDPIPWSLPGGMKNYQAGKRTVRPISVEFVVATNAPDGTANRGSVYRMLEKWSHATYDLDSGNNIGKANYCTDGITIRCRGERGDIKYGFNLMRAQVTDCHYGTLNSETNDLLRVSASFIYDNYKVLASGGTVNIRNT